MKRLKGAEVWTDQDQVVAVKTNGGDYKVFVALPYTHYIAVGVNRKIKKAKKKKK